MRRLRNQAQLCTRTLSLAAAVYVVLMLVGRVSSMAHVNFLSQAEAHAGGPAPASAAASAEQSNGEKKPFTAEWDEDDDYHSPPCRSPDSHPYEGRLLGLHRPHLVFVSRVANTNFSRGPPRL